MFDTLPFLTFITIAALTPGPNNCMALSHGVHGLKRGMSFCLGVGVGMLLVMLVCAFCSSTITRHIEGQAQLAMQVMGVAYMLWLAWSLWCSKGISPVKKQSGNSLMALGCVLQLINPKLILYGLTAYSVFLLPVFSDNTTLALCALILAGMGFMGTVIWAMGGLALEKLFARHPLAINRILAAMVVACAFSMLR